MWPFSAVESVKVNFCSEMSAEAAAPAPASAPVASGLDAYEVLCPIGRGSFGTVSKIVRRADGRVLVWKEMCYGGA